MQKQKQENQQIFLQCFYSLSLSQLARVGQYCEGLSPSVGQLPPITPPSPHLSFLSRKVIQRISKGAT